MAPDDSTPPVDDATPPPVDSTAADNGSSTAVNALIGGVVGIILSFVPLSTVLGGAIAGYLDGTTPEDGLKVGALAGLVMLVPFVALAGFFLLVFAPPGAPVGVGLFGLFVLFFGMLYTVGLGALGGYLGVYVENEL